MNHTFKYIYGPVYSWRLGISLGIDPLSAKEKVCNYNCVYCQLGPTRQLACERRIFVPAEAPLQELRSLMVKPFDYLTFSGRGEPTLAANLGEMIRLFKKYRREKIAVITNSSLLHRADVRDDLAEADFVLAKLDAGTSEGFERVDQALGTVAFDRMIKGIRDFRLMFRGKLALQMMFVAENIDQAGAMAQIARSINADEVEINTPTRICASQALSETEIECIKSSFQGLPAVTVYERAQKTVEPLDLWNTTRRHGRYHSLS